MRVMTTEPSDTFRPGQPLTDPQEVQNKASKYFDLLPLIELIIDAERDYILALAIELEDLVADMPNLGDTAEAASLWLTRFSEFVVDLHRIDAQ